MMTFFHHAYVSVVALFTDLAKLDTDSIIFVILLTITVIVADGVMMSIAKLKKSAGIAKNSKTISIDGGKSAKTKEYICEAIGLAGRPDAVIEENGFLIPVERKPMQKKIHERQIAQLLVYMRLIEHAEGKRPPHGYLVLGKNCKQVKIENTNEKQRWLDEILDKMQAHLNQDVPLVATPHPIKCSKCPVRNSCTVRRGSSITYSPSDKPDSLKTIH